MDIILASQSEFRQNLLKQIHLPFKAISSNIDESDWKAKIHDPKKLATELSYQKAKDVSLSHPNSIIIGSDQVCFCEGEFLSKPKGFDLSLIHI